MAGGALRSEVRLACLCVADDDVQLDFFTGRRAALAAHRESNAVDELGDRLDVFLAQRQRRHRRHARILPTVLDDRHNQLAVLIVEHQLRAQQVGSADVAAAKVAAMARPAVDLVEGLAARDRRGIGERALLRRERRTSAASPLAGGLTAARRRTGRRRCLRRSSGRSRGRGLLRTCMRYQRDQPHERRRDHSFPYLHPNTSIAKRSGAASGLTPNLRILLQSFSAFGEGGRAAESDMALVRLQNATGEGEKGRKLFVTELAGSAACGRRLLQRCSPSPLALCCI